MPPDQAAGDLNDQPSFYLADRAATHGCQDKHLIGAAVHANMHEWPQASTAILLIAATVIAMDHASAVTREQLQ